MVLFVFPSTCLAGTTDTPFDEKDQCCRIESVGISDLGANFPRDSCAGHTLLWFAKDRRVERMNLHAYVLEETNPLRAGGKSRQSMVVTCLTE